MIRMFLLILLPITLIGQSASISGASKKKSSGAAAPTDYWAHWIAEDHDGDGNSGNNGSSVTTWQDLSGNGRHIDDFYSNGPYPYTDDIENGYGGIFVDWGFTYSASTPSFYDTLTEITLVLVTKSIGSIPTYTYGGFAFYDNVDYLVYSIGTNTINSVNVVYPHLEDTDVSSTQISCDVFTPATTVLILTINLNTDSYKFTSDCHGSIISDSYSFTDTQWEFDTDGAFEFGFDSFTTSGIYLIEAGIFDRELSDEEINLILNDLVTKYGL